MYVMLCTRPSVAYTLSVTSRYQINHAEAHYVAVKKSRNTCEELRIYS
jgi:hypothetical protein